VKYFNLRFRFDFRCCFSSADVKALNWSNGGSETFGLGTLESSFPAELSDSLALAEEVLRVETEGL